MRTFVRVAPPAENPAVPEGVIRLSFEKRCLSRQRARLEDGSEAGLILPRGTRLKDGDLLQTEDGRTVQVRASLEELSVADCPTPLALARVAYHLGNRHAAVMLEGSAVKYPADPVLDRMVAGMGIAVRRVLEPFQPESGAYDFTPGDARASLLSTPPTITFPGGRPSSTTAAGLVESPPSQPVRRPPASAGKAYDSGASLNSTALLQLMRLASPALPIGGYAYSQGLEQAVQAGLVDTEDSLIGWLEGVLRSGLATLDLPMLGRMRRAWAGGDEAAAHALGRELLAWRDCAEARLEERQMGGALAKILVESGVEAAGTQAGEQATYLGTFALACSAWSIPERESLLAFAFSWAENQVTAGVKLIPLGQKAGQRVLVRMMGPIDQAVRAALERPDGMLSTSTPGRGLAQLFHAGQGARMFRS